MKDANHYTLRVFTPQYFQDAVSALDFKQRLSFAAELASCVRDGHTSFLILSGESYQWLTRQSFFTFNNLLKWITSELL